MDGSKAKEAPPEVPHNGVMEARRSGGKVVLRTARLELVELSPDDLPFLRDVLMHPEVMRFWPRPYLESEIEGWMDKQRTRYREDGYGYWLVRLGGSGEPVGLAGVLATRLEDETAAAMGWIVHKPHWRQGYAFEAASGCFHHGFEVLGEERLISLVRPENLPSMALAAKLGMSEGPIVPFSGFPHTRWTLDRNDYAKL